MDVFQRLRSGYENISQGDEDSFINGNGEKKMNGGVGGLREKASKTSMKSRVIAIGSLFVVVLLMTGFSHSRGEPIPITAPEPIVPGAQYLHVVITANQKDHNVCKSVVSAASLNYPVPSLLNWKVDFNDTSRAEGGAQFARVDSVLSYIALINKIPKRLEDVVIVVDGFDTWFQLRPDVIMERFFEINRLANNRVVRRMGQAAMDAGHIQQRVIFGAQKSCSREADDPACYAVPESTLPRNAYGSNHEKPEKYLNSGFIMGELGGVQRVFERARDIIESDKEKATAQDAFSRIFGEQEYQRELIRQRYIEPPSLYQRFLQSLHLSSIDKGVLAPHPTHHKIAAVPAGEAEFGIGLDYESLLASSTERGSDLDWIVRNNTSEISNIRSKAKVNSSNRFYTLANDILRSLEPFWARNPSKTLPQSLGWEDTSLYTNLWTGAVPATIQHTSPRSETGKDHIRQAGWKKMWFQPYARTMLDEHVNEPYRSFATLRNEDSETAWWPLHQQKWRIRDHTNLKVKEWLPWKDVCDDFQDEVFADGKGPWKAPRLEY